jgi:hypothetical protein
MTERPHDSAAANGSAGRPQPKPVTTDTQAKPRTTAKMKAQARAATRAAERLKLGGRLPAPGKRGKRKAPADDAEEWENVPPPPTDEPADAIMTAASTTRSPSPIQGVGASMHAPRTAGHRATPGEDAAEMSIAIGMGDESFARGIQSVRQHSPYKTRQKRAPSKSRGKTKAKLPIAPQPTQRYADPTDLSRTRDPEDVTSEDDDLMELYEPGGQLPDLAAPPCIDPKAEARAQRRRLVTLPDVPTHHESAFLDPAQLFSEPVPPPLRPASRLPCPVPGSLVAALPSHDTRLRRGELSVDERGSPTIQPPRTHPRPGPRSGSRSPPARPYFALYPANRQPSPLVRPREYLHVALQGTVRGKAPAARAPAMSDAHYSGDEYDPESYNDAHAADDRLGRSYQSRTGRFEYATASGSGTRHNSPPPRNDRAADTPHLDLSAMAKERADRGGVSPGRRLARTPEPQGPAPMLVDPAPDMEQRGRVVPDDIATTWPRP